MDQEAEGGSDGLPHEDQMEEEEEDAHAIDAGDVVVAVTMGHVSVPGRSQEDDAIVRVSAGTGCRVMQVDSATRSKK